MSDTKPPRITPDTIKARKNAAPIICLTAYSTPVAKALDDACDLILVGDSLGMVLYGMENTLTVTLDMMINHGKAVMRGTQNACVVVDMPYGSYEQSPQQALENAQHIMNETGCSAVKLEGGVDMVQTIEFLTSHDIPVMAHIGLQPQSVVKDGGYKVKGKTTESEDKLFADAHGVAKAGAFSVVIEGTIEDVAKRLSAAIDIPTIGIGASAACDGQVLVTDDMLGLTTDHIPKFVKHYETLAERIKSAAQNYAKDVSSRTFPAGEHTYKKK